MNFFLFFFNLYLNHYLRKILRVVVEVSFGAKVARPFIIKNSMKNKIRAKKFKFTIKFFLAKSRKSKEEFF